MMKQIGMTIGETYHQRYEVIEPLSSGGFGAVYKAKDLQAEPDGYQLVAVKHIVKESEISNLNERLRLRRQIEQEVHILRDNSSSLGFIPNYIDYWSEPLGDDDTMQHFLVMEFIPGKSLKGDERRKWSPDEMFRFLEDMLRDLESLHQLKLYHRDLKPDNIIRRIDDGRFCIVDFGFSNQQTSTIVLGLTPDYASPEHYNPNARVEGQSDLYCLGVTAYHLFSGSLPIRAKHRNSDEILDFPAGANPLPKYISDTILEMLAFDLTIRLASAKIALTRLRDRKARRPVEPIVSRRPRSDVVLDPDRSNRSSNEDHKPTTVTDVTTLSVSDTLGHGRITGLSWAAESSTLLITTAIGIYHYQYRAGSPGEPRLLLNTPEPVLSAALSRDGRQLTIAQARWIEQRSIHNNREINRIPCESPDTAMLSADGKMIAIMGDSGVALGPVTTTSSNQPASIAAFDPEHVALSRDGATIAALIDGRLRRWRLEEDVLVESPRLHGSSGILRHVALNLDGSLIATANEGTIQLWDENGYEKKKLVPVARPIERIALDSMGKQIAFAAQQQLYLRSFSDPSEQRMAIPADPLIGLSFSADGTILAAATSNCVWIWPFGKKEQPRTLWEDVAGEQVAFSNDGKLLLTAGNALACYSVAEGHLNHAEMLASSIKSPRGLAVHGHERKCLVALADSKPIQIWQRAKHKQRELNWKLLPPLKSSAEQVLNSSAEQVCTITFSMGGRQIVSVTANGVETWSITAELGEQRIFPIPLPVYDAALSSNGQTLATYDGVNIMIWAATNGTWGHVRTIDKNIKDINTIALSSDGKFLAIGSDRAVRLLDSGNGDTLAEKEEDECGAKGLVFAPNTKVLAAIWGSKLRLWGIEEIHSLKPGKSYRASLRDLGSSHIHTECICDLAFAAGQTMFATASHDGTVRLWHYNDLVA